MNLEAEKLSLIKWLVELEDEKLINAVKSIKAIKNKRISIEQYKKELEEAEAEINAGLGISHEELIEEMKGW